MTGAKLQLAGLEVAYGPVQVVHGVSADLAPGSVTVILGPNGAGKSTTCKAVAGYLPLRHGSIVFDGVDITARPCWWRARHGIMLIPEGRGIFPGLSVDDNLRILLPKGADRAQVYDRYRVLGERRRQQAGSLSGGEQQMLSLAPILVHRVEVLIADDPTLGLAPRAANEVCTLYAELSGQGVAVLLVGESPHGLVEIADRVSLLHVGRITWSGAPTELDQATLEASYFGDISE
jgi:ABC-type branched-subunit amino acid transport system ATPase component